MNPVVGLAHHHYDFLLKKIILHLGQGSCLGGILLGLNDATSQQG